MKTLCKRRFIGDGAFYKRALFIALPVMAQLLLQNLVSLIDNFMVSGLGDVKMSGVNVANQVNFVFFVLLGTICSSAGIFMSQYHGARDGDGQKQVFRFKLIFAFLAGALYMGVCFIAPRPLFYAMVSINRDAEVIIDQCVKYSRAVAPSILFMALSQSIATSFRDIEIVRAPLFISVGAALVNTFFNFVFIYGNFGAPRMEVAGAALATVIARAVELVVFCIYAAHKRPDFLFNILKLFRVDKNLFLNIFKKSLMILYSEMTWAVSETVSTALFNTRGGSDVVSGMAAGFTIANLFLISCQGTATVTSVIMGQTLGANDLDDAVCYKNYLMTGSIFFGTLFMLLGFASTLLIPHVFGKLTLLSQHYARTLVITMAIYLPSWAFINVEYSVLRSGGDTFNGVVSDTVANVLFLASMFALTFGTTLGPVAMYAIVKLSDLAKVIIAAIGVHKRKWLVNLTVKKKQ